MGIKKQYDKEIKKALLQNTDKIEPSAKLFEKIKSDIYNQEGEVTMKSNVMGRKKGRGLAIIAASFILLSALTVLGVTMKKSWVGYSDIDYKHFPSKEQALKDVGFTPKYPKSLPGGFEYIDGGTGKSALSDEAGNVLTETKDISLRYKRSNDKSMLTLSVEKVEEKFLDRTDSQLVGDLNGIELYYYNKDYKFVPPNYELTEEDKKAYEAGELEISYGTSEIALSNIQGLSWYEDGLKYLIMGSDYHFTVEELTEMAKVVMEQ